MSNYLSQDEVPIAPLPPGAPPWSPGWERRVIDPKTGKPVAVTGTSFYGSGGATAAASVEAKIRQVTETITHAAAPQPGYFPAPVTVVVDEDALRRLAEAQERIQELTMNLQRERRSRRIEGEEAERLALLERQVSPGDLGALVGQTPVDAVACVRWLVSRGVDKRKAVKMCVKALAKKQVMAQAIPTALEYFSY